MMRITIFRMKSNTFLRRKVLHFEKRHEKKLKRGGDMVIVEMIFSILLGMSFAFLEISREKKWALRIVKLLKKE